MGATTFNRSGSDNAPLMTHWRYVIHFRTNPDWLTSHAPLRSNRRDRARRSRPPLQPAPHARLVVPVGAAEPPFQISFLARDHAVPHRDRQWQQEDQDPRA